MSSKPLQHTTVPSTDVAAVAIVAVVEEHNTASVAPTVAATVAAGVAIAAADTTASITVAVADTAVAVAAVVDTASAAVGVVVVEAAVAESVVAKDTADISTGRNVNRQAMRRTHRSTVAGEHCNASAWRVDAGAVVAAQSLAAK